MLKPGGHRSLRGDRGSQTICGQDISSCWFHGLTWCCFRRARLESIWKLVSGDTSAEAFLRHCHMFLHMYIYIYICIYVCSLYIIILVNKHISIILLYHYIVMLLSDHIIRLLCDNISVLSFNIIFDMCLLLVSHVFSLFEKQALSASFQKDLSAGSLGVSNLGRFECDLWFGFESMDWIGQIA